MQAMRPPETINIFYCYAHEDKYWQEKLQKHLSNLKRQKLISDWHYRDIRAGQNWQKTIDTYLNNAHIILLLISSDFMDSDYCHSIEMIRALERHENGEAIVIPILLKSVDFANAPFSHLQMLPRGQKAVAEWNSSSRDRIFTDIVLEIRKVIFDILDKPDPVDELFDQVGMLDANPRRSRSTRAATPRRPNTRTKSRTSKQNPAQALANIVDTRKKFFPKTNKKPIFDDIRELLTDLEVPNFFDFLRTSLKLKKFRRYRKGKRSFGWWFFFACDVVLPSWAMYNWTHFFYGVIATFLVLLLLLLWNSINEAAFVDAIFTILFTIIWFVLGAMYLQHIPFIHEQFIIFILICVFFSYLRFEQFKPTR